MARTASLSRPRAPKRNSNTARTHCGPPRPAAQSDASAPRCLQSEGGSREVGRAVLPHQGAVSGVDWGCSAGCNTWPGGWGIPCRKGEERQAGEAAREPRQGVGAGWRCCGGWRGGRGAGTLLPGSGMRMRASCDSRLVNVEGRTWSLTLRRPVETCQAWAGCRSHKTGPREPERPGSDRVTVEGAGSRARGSRGPDSPCTLCCPQASPRPGAQTHRERGIQSPAS